MNTNQKDNLIDEMLAQLESGRQSITKQTNLIAEIMEKSNNMLLQIETTRVLKPPPTATTAEGATTPYTYTKDTVQSLSKIIEQFQWLLLNNKPIETGRALNFEDYLVTSRQRMEYLGGSVRKLLAVAHTVDEMRQYLLQQDEGCYSGDEEEDEFGSKEPSSE